MPPMFLLELFATMRARRRSTQRQNEEGVEITKRLRELLDSTMPKRVETPPPIAASGRFRQSRGPFSRKER